MVGTRELDLPPALKEVGRIRGRKRKGVIATRGNQERDGDAPSDKAVLCASYQVWKGTHFGSPWVVWFWVCRLELNQHWSAALCTLSKTALRVSKPE